MDFWQTEAVNQICSVKKFFFKISQNSQENTCARVSFFKKRLWHRCFSMNFVKLKNTYFYRTPPITASVQNFVSISNQIEVGLCSNRGEEVFSKVFASEEHHLYLSLSKTMVMVVLIILVSIVWLILSVWTFLHFIELLPETFEFHFCNELLFPA